MGLHFATPTAAIHSSLSTTEVASGVEDPDPAIGCWAPSRSGQPGPHTFPGEGVVRIRPRPQSRWGDNNGTASLVIRSTICFAVGTSVTSPTPQPAYIAMAATLPVVNVVG